MESAGIRNILKERTLERDRIEYERGDALDVKAGLVLVVLTFLAGQTIDLSKDILGRTDMALVVISTVAVIVGTVSALWQWLPVKYGVLSHPAKYKPWLEDLIKRHLARNLPDNDTVAHLENLEISQATERINTNIAISKKKLRLMKACFICVFLSLLANLLVVFRYLFPLCHWVAAAGR
jgi:hypothetical protein